MIIGDNCNAKSIDIIDRNKCYLFLVTFSILALKRLEWTREEESIPSINDLIKFIIFEVTFNNLLSRIIRKVNRLEELGINVIRNF